jgi:hypothetical protein
MGSFSKFVEQLEARRFLSASITPSAGGVSLTETAHDRFTVKLGAFTQKVVDLALNAVIQWGDGTRSDGKLVGSYETGEYYVQGSHSYARTGKYKVDVDIFAHPLGLPGPLPGVGAIDSFDSVITVKPLFASPGGTTITGIAGKQLKDVRLGEVTVKVTDLSLNAKIEWGDGTTTDGKMVGSYETGEYYIQGTHTYAKPGTYKVSVGVYAKPIGSSIHPTDPIAGFTSVIHALGTTKGGTILSKTAGQSFTAKLGEFHQKVSDLTLTAKILWGDGTTSEGTIEGSYATGDWYVEGTHSYAKKGIYTVTVKVFAKPIGSTITPTDPINQFVSLIEVKPRR